ncbi:serine hydrolase domain-containing protein [Sphingobacterium sp. MYb388]|uniref:serine hydrolase domain-containing protein n=1 Tax=Sphingobacterium sp. MYb388 TaxID=2745437 RepID=UPI00309F4A26
MLKKISSYFVLLLISTGSYAQNIDSQKLDSYFASLEQNNKFMGSVAISKNGTLIYSKSVGFSDLENNKKATTNSKYRIGSISKTFTSVLVLKAVEMKKLKLDQTIESFFPTIKNAKKITVEHLLSHRSGIHNFTDDKDYLTWNTQPKTEKEMVAIIAKAGSDFEPDSKAQYSNSNFVLLTYMLEKSFKKSYTDLLKEFITKPLDLKNTYMGGKINPAKEECKSYTFNEKWILQPETDISIPLGAGGVVSTPSDLVDFSNALFNGKLLNPENLEIMKSIKDQYGVGLFQIPFYDKIGYGHTGGIDGFSSVFSHFDDENIDFALTSNGTNFNNNNIAIALLSAVYNKPYDIPNFSSHEVSSEDLDKYLGIYASKQIPLKITITKDKKTLMAQATGQSAFPLEATEKDKFKFEQAGIVLEFRPEEKTMKLKQGGGEFLFNLE